VAVGAHGVTIRFGGQLALSDVSLEVRQGSIHAIAGENGAGKSTLIKILAGIHRPDTGSLQVSGQHVVIRDPWNAAELGLGFLHQHLSLVHGLTVRENLLLTTRYPTRQRVRIDWRAVQERAEHYLNLVGLNVDPCALVGDLTPGQQQLVGFARVLLQDPKVIILDEPTAALGEVESRNMLEIIRQRQSSGVTVIFISHRLDEIMKIASRVTVLRDGKLVATVERSAVTREQLVHMLGGAGEHHEHMGLFRARAPVARLEAKEVVSTGFNNPITMSIDPGEVVGLAGLAGSGRTRFAEVLAGARPVFSGSLIVNGSSVRLRNRRDAIRHGIVMLPADRSRAVIPDFTIPPNITLGNASGYAYRHLVLAKRREKLAANRYIRELRIKTGKSDGRMRYLSGGNQQKVLLARALDLKPAILILDEPTAGIDIATKEYVYQLVRDLASTGMSVIFISSELDELPLVSDRILVFAGGQITAHMTGRSSRAEIVAELFAQSSRERTGSTVASAGARA
jgi:ABC-type sugar transport system ATPase subunit